MRDKNISIGLISICIAAAFILMPLAISGQTTTDAKVTIFGQEIGSALTLPACPLITKKINGKKQQVIAGEADITTICYVGKIAQATVLIIQIPENKRALYIRRTYGNDFIPMRMHIIDGLVQGVDFLTFYAETEQKDALYSDLKDKFGEHTKAIPREWQNSNGAKFTRYEYDWASPQYLVSLTESEVNDYGINGKVTIYTPIAAAFLAAVEQELKKKADEERRKRQGGL